MRNIGDVKKYTWKEYDSDIHDIYEVLDNFGKKYHLIGIYRGSLLMGQHLSNLLETNFSIVKFQTRDSDDLEVSWIYKDNLCVDQEIIILDDIYDTGKTLNTVREFIHSECPNCRVQAFTLFNQSKCPTWVASLNKTDKWVQFPWEI
jgi:hypoxanthine phosphoribosyltransferase